MEKRRKKRKKRSQTPEEPLQDKGCVEKKAKSQDGFVFPTDKPNLKEKTSPDGNVKMSPCGEKPPEDGTIKRKRTEEPLRIKDSQEEERKSLSDETSKPESKKRKKDEEEKNKKKSSSEEFLQSSSYGRSKEQEDNKEKKRSREDLLEGKGIMLEIYCFIFSYTFNCQKWSDAYENAKKKSRVEVRRPPPLDIQSYTFHRKLGEGTGGKVMLASFAPKKQLVAIKIVQKKPNRCNYPWIMMEAQLSKFARECPFLCHSHATFQSKAQAFFVLEYAGGGTLYRMISRQKTLPTKSIQFYSAEMVVALQFLHYNGIIHRDLKPDNILVDNDGHIKICDFGIAAVGMFAGWKIRGLAGTPGYRAPEMLSLEAYDAGVDWWSLGVIMYEMATGRLPFVPSLDPAREFVDMKQTKVDYPSHMSQEMLDLLPKPPADKLKEIKPGFCTETSEENKLEDFSNVDSNWNWQE
uniref:Protein kinase domain-containing protein n=1 Tax=Xenopus tropicalis TaxID=8364 RepID=A0A1B8XVH7_XENTR